MEGTDKPGYWGVMPAEVRYAEIPAAAKVLYSEISALTQMDGLCVKDNAYFCNLYQISERTLQGHLQKLEKAGFISILDGDGGQGRRRIYAGINPLSKNPAKICGVVDEPRKNLRGNPAKNCGDNKVIDQDISPDKPPKAPQGGRRSRSYPECKHDPEAFERFWKAYPKAGQKDKALARREWDKLKPDHKLMQIMSAALERDKASDKWLRGIGIPYACRWLSHLRWEDTPDETPRQNTAAPENREEDAIWL